MSARAGRQMAPSKVLNRPNKHGRPLCARTCRQCQLATRFCFNARSGAAVVQTILSK